MAVNLNNIIDEYKRLVDLNNINITLDNNDKIRFRFKIENLPHLLGLQHITDIPLFYKYSEKQIYAGDLLKEIKSGAITQNEIDSSKLFKETYDNRIQYVNYEHISNLLLNGNVSSFNSQKVKFFDTKLEKIDYMIWNNLNDGYGHLGLGFSVKNNLGHPSTFFYRNNKDYIENQKVHNKLTLNIENLKNNEPEVFKIYWENVSDSLIGTTHYKKLEKHANKIGCDVKNLTEDIVHSLDSGDYDKEFIIKEFNLLQMDKAQKIYEPYFLDKYPKFKWNNKEKLFIIKTINEKNEDLLPNEVSVLLNDFRQKNYKN